MIDQTKALAIVEATELRRAQRRRFLTMAGGGAAALGSLALLSACGHDHHDGSSSSGSLPTPSPSPSPTPTPTAVTDVDVLNFALNLEYLEAQFYSYAVTGAGLPANQLTGSGVQGAVTGGRAVAFKDPVVQQYAREIALDEGAHVAFLRGAINSAGGQPVAQPAINIDGGMAGAFTAAARAAGVIGPADTFDPYASDENFLLGAFIFEDVGVTAYKGAAPLITNKTYLEAAAGILAAEAYHAGLVRTTLYRKGIANPALMLIENAGKISDARDSLDGPDDLDQGIASPDGGVTSNIVPADANAIAFGRSTGQVLNIVYLSKSMLSSGGFFPAGVNGTLRISAAS
ncbi:MAG: ferritin-like domain-containing protein [Sphingomonas sp.]|uniref:ferritin-like domain-containing protein n=1 Tax=Sphingomonas sp. TaxID=28214 RepID=UPI003F802A27